MRKEAPTPTFDFPPGNADDWIDEVFTKLGDLSPDDAGATTVLQLYIGRQEYVEILYAPGGLLVDERYPELGTRVRTAEQGFHDLIAISQDRDARTSPRFRDAVEHLSALLRSVREGIRSAGLPVHPPEPDAKTALTRPDERHPPELSTTARSPEIQAVLTDLDSSLAKYADGQHIAALRLVEETSLERFEALEERRDPGRGSSRPRG